MRETKTWKARKGLHSEGRDWNWGCIRGFWAGCTGNGISKDNVQARRLDGKEEGHYRLRASGNRASCLGLLYFANGVTGYRAVDK